MEIMRKGCVRKKKIGSVAGNLSRQNLFGCSREPTATNLHELEVGEGVVGRRRHVADEAKDGHPCANHSLRVVDCQNAESGRWA